MPCIFLLLSLIAAVTPVLAQPVVAPTPESTGRVRGENLGDYNVTNQFELGVRFHSVDGNLARYRSDVNYGNGVRLLGSRLTIHSREGHGKWFDEIVLNTQGLGNDPYQFAGLRIQHNTLYRYDFTFRINDYVNPGLTTGTLGGHAMNTRRQWQDHDFVLLPRSRFRLLAGYSGNRQDGPGLVTTQLFDSRGDEYPLFADIDRRQREFRLGAEATAAGFRFLILRGWQRYEENSPAIQAAHPGASVTDLNQLTSFTRTEPYSGDTPFWRFNAQQERESWYSIGARFSYAGGRRDFRLDEMAAGLDRRGTDRVRQVLVKGSGRRPVSTGSVTLSLFPSRNLTLTNHTAFHQIQMDGDGVYQEINNATLGLNLFRFQYLGLRSLVNQTDLNLKAARWLGLYGGYHFSDRRIRSREEEAVEGFDSDVRSHEQTNRIHSGLAGLRLQPVRPLRISLDGEIGRADQPFFPLSERKFHTYGARVQYRTRALTFGAASKTSYNANSVSLFTHSARSRTNSVDVSWTPKTAFSLDAGYSKQHFDSLTGIAYFTANLVEGERSLYVSNIHAIHGGVRWSWQSRVDLYAGYTRVQDTGDGRSAAAAATGSAADATASAVFRAVQTFPVAYQSPQARVSVRLHTNLRWNLGWQYYNYDEDFFRVYNYRAHTGFTSIMWSF
ncbi:MAG: hypothetical protein R2762_22435 [Bryobacteraceae bacterium]